MQTNIIANYKKCFKNYVNFKEQADSREYWLFVLANLIVSVTLAAITNFIEFFILRGAEYSGLVNVIGYIFGAFFILQALYILVMITPLISVTIRRIIGAGVASAVSYLLALIPIVGVPVALNLSAFAMIMQLTQHIK